jgi:hypothetical protein
MPFNVGDVVSICATNALRNNRQLGRIKQVLPKRHSVQDLQEYVVEFRHERLQRFQFFLYREFELRGLTSD